MEMVGKGCGSAGTPKIPSEKVSFASKKTLQPANFPPFGSRLLLARKRAAAELVPPEGDSNILAAFTVFSFAKG
jgi:hypothetical protein